MKENRMNDGGRLKRSALRGGTEKLNGSRKIQTALVAVLAVMALVLLSGCASVHGNPDPLQYNPNTGYPAVGGEFPWVFGL